MKKPNQRIIMVKATITNNPNGVKIVDFSNQLPVGSIIKGLFVNPPTGQYDNTREGKRMASVSDMQSIMLTMKFENQNVLENVPLSTFAITPLRTYYPFEFTVVSQTLENSFLLATDSNVFSNNTELFIPLYFVVQ